MILIDTPYGYKGCIDEFWIQISNYEGLYEVSSLGNVRSLDKTVKCRGGKTRVIPGRVLKKHNNGNGYQFVRLTKNGVSKNKYVHRLVIMSFTHMSIWSESVNHSDGDKKNNRLLNLQWMSRSENLKHAYRTGLNHVSDFQKKRTSLANRGSKQNNSVLNESDIPEIRLMRENGATHKEIAKEFGVHRETIGNIIRGNTWTHV